MTEDEKHEVADIAQVIVLAAMKELVAQLMPVNEKIADNTKRVMSTVDNMVAAVKQIQAIVVKVARSDTEGHNAHADAIEQLMAAQSKTMKFADGLAQQYGQIFKALSARIDALEAWKYGEPEPPPPPRAN